MPLPIAGVATHAEIAAMSTPTKPHENGDVAGEKTGPMPRAPGALATVRAIRLWVALAFAVSGFGYTVHARLSKLVTAAQLSEVSAAIQREVERVTKLKEHYDGLASKASVEHAQIRTSLEDAREDLRFLKSQAIETARAVGARVVGRRE